ncbi:unnamed protein product [Paramecium sonneborni]|uniref:Uncharacterized protein n=1 Tax=Paramecium sonneborni TaxID=65129 RepID=A0A8S1M7E0_9CILI|nr:unnamed protein product [Paramecium sonneborni]CAD8073595.1 unnamed protein product [Paramecium sonneborni]
MLDKYKNSLMSCSAFKESGVLKGWGERLLIYDLMQQILRYIDVKGQTQKQLLIQNYIIHPVAFHQGKWAIKLKTQQEIEPKVVRFGWNNQSEALQWYDFFNGKYLATQIKKENQEKTLQEWDQFMPESERVINQGVPLMAIKPSQISRMRQMIPLLPQFLQNDIEIILENTHENLQGFSDIHSFKVLFQSQKKQLYQDPNDSLHMRFFLKSEMPPARIFDELSIHTFVDNWNPQVSIYQVYPTKKDCAIIFTEFDMDQKLSNNQLKQNEFVSQESFCKQSKSHSLNSNQKIRLIYTQKHFQIDENSYCILKKYIGNEIHHNQIDKDRVEGADKYKITRSCVLIQAQQEEKFKTQIIEDVYLECENREKGEEVMKRFLLNFENIDNQIIEADHYIKQQTEHVLIKNDDDDIDNLQISFIQLVPEVPRITSEQHQQQSPQEYMEILDLVQRGHFIQKSIQRQFNQSILSGLDKFLGTSKEDGHFLLTKYYEVDPKKGGLIYTNKKLISDQRSVLLDIIKRMGSNLLSGKSLMSVSLPIQVFEARSFLERMARAQGHAPVFLEKAAQTTDVFEQLRLTVAFHISSFMMGVQQEKPFNPIIGETFEGRIKGCPIYLEQTSHHPPISNYIMYGRDYKLFGAFCPLVNMGTNSLAGEQQGHSQIHYLNTNLKFYYMAQPFMLYGVLLGQRSVNCHKRSYCFQPDNQLLVEITFNPKDKNAGFFSSSSQKIDQFIGKVCKVTPECIQKCLKAHKTNSGIKLKILPQEILDTYKINIQGRWTSILQFDNITYWDIEIHKPYILELESNPLPSDSLYRLDLLYMKMKEISKAQDIKEKLEVDQRMETFLLQKMLVIINNFFFQINQNLQKQNTMKNIYQKKKVLFFQRSIQGKTHQSIMYNFFALQSNHFFTIFLANSFLNNKRDSSVILIFYFYIISVSKFDLSQSFINFIDSRIQFLVQICKSFQNIKWKIPRILLLYYQKQYYYYKPYLKYF